jgi:hypothetical protein
MNLILVHDIYKSIPQHLTIVSLQVGPRIVVVLRHIVHIHVAPSEVRPNAAVYMIVTQQLEKAD